MFAQFKMLSFDRTQKGIWNHEFFEFTVFKGTTNPEKDLYNITTKNMEIHAIQPPPAMNTNFTFTKIRTPKYDSGLLY